MENIDPNNLNITIDENAGTSAEAVRAAFQSIEQPEMVNVATGEKLKFSSASAKIHDAPAGGAAQSGSAFEEFKELLPLMENPALIDKEICNRVLILVKKDMSCMLVYIWPDQRELKHLPTEKKRLARKRIDLLTFGVEESLVSRKEFEDEATLRNNDEWHRHNYFSPMMVKMQRLMDLRKNMFYVDIPMSASKK